MAVNVPEDLITGILQLLPAKTLLRLRCVSKSLLGIIDSPKFINTHLARVSSNSETHSKIIVLEQLDRINPVSIHVFHIEDPIPPELRGAGNSTYPIPCLYWNTLFAHCNGLVVLEEDPYSLVVWNATTRKCWKLPVLPREVPEDRLGNRISGLCIGYDSSVDDYKVMLIKERRIIILEWDDGDYNCQDIYEIWILGLKSGYWRRIKHPGGSYNKIYDTRNCFVDEAFHFNCDGGQIFAFDSAKETSSRVCLPNFDQIQDYEINLQVLEGHLCVTFYSYRPYEVERLKLYVREKNDVGDFF